jgi:cold shock CspA family protein
MKAIRWKGSGRMVAWWDEQEGFGGFAPAEGQELVDVPEFAREEFDAEVRSLVGDAANEIYLGDDAGAAATTTAVASGKPSKTKKGKRITATASSPEALIHDPADAIEHVRKGKQLKKGQAVTWDDMQEVIRVLKATE